MLALAEEPLDSLNKSHTELKALRFISGTRD